MRYHRHILSLICSSVVAQGVFLLQSADNPVTQAPTTRTSETAPLPPIPRPQVTYFRELLALSPDDLDQALTGIVEPARNKLRAKLQEYATLGPGEREARLRATELHWHLALLMRMPSTNRDAQLATIPPQYQALVGERLKYWDALPLETKKEFQDNEWTIPYLVRLQSASTPHSNLPLELQEKLDKQLAAWLALPPAKRQRICDLFEQFFDLTPGDRQKTLDALSDAERREMEDTLQAFGKLPPEQRRVCVASFRKFANLTPAERAQFLKNAGRWKEMSPDDRRTWRMLVTKLPPLPPDFGKPPLPPGYKGEKAFPTSSPAAISLTNAAH